jgi:hypothetical protein
MHTENEITAWLEPLFEAAESTDIDLWALVERATVRVDWVRFGQLLRHELGWAGYPENPAVVREQLRRKRELIRHQICEQISDLGGLG